MYVVVTSLTISAEIHAVWQKVRFYKEVTQRPPLFLRLSLPHPMVRQVITSLHHFVMRDMPHALQAVQS